MEYVLTEEEIAGEIRSTRLRKGLTQEDVALRLIESGRYERVTKQAISKAENYKPSDGMSNLRVAVYELLTGEKLNGPVWYRH